MEKILSHKISAFEKSFWEWLQVNSLPLTHTGQGTIWINRRNPDFRVNGQKKAVELSQQMVFTPKLGTFLRTVESYGLPTIQHYEKHRWRCLVVFQKRGQEFSNQLKNAILDFSSDQSNWSGVWNYDQLIRLSD